MTANNSGAFLVTYRPIGRTAAGRAAADRFGIPPYVDGSCRREPDFESPYPTITALCRGGNFAPRLKVGHRVAYITKRGAYDSPEPHWRLTALLRVVRRFESHLLAAAWYTSLNLPLPRNLIVPGNSPLPLEATDGVIPAQLKHRAELTAEGIVQRWDARYALRSRQVGVVLSCEPLFLNVQNPPRITAADWLVWNGSTPSTRNPPQITEELWKSVAGRAV
jgi:hypothetical protein